MSRVTKAMKAKPPKRRRSFRVLKKRWERAFVGPARLSLKRSDGTVLSLGVVSSVSYFFGSSLRMGGISFEPVSGEKSDAPAG